GRVRAEHAGGTGELAHRRQLLRPLRRPRAGGLRGGGVQSGGGGGGVGGGVQLPPPPCREEPEPAADGGSGLAPAAAVAGEPAQRPAGEEEEGLPGPL